MEYWLKRVVLCLLLAWGTLFAPPAARADGHPKIDLDQGWVALFNGKDLAGWRVFDPQGGQAAPNAWVVEDGALTRKDKGYLTSTGAYGDFILDLEFKMGPKTNSGIFLRFDPKYSAGKPHYWFNGALEIQIADSTGRQPVGKHDCGALYDMVAPSRNAMKPVGQWNRVTITAQGSRIAVVLNGVNIVDADLDDWATPGKNPDGTDLKYHLPMKDAPRRGHILLQDHPGQIHFRNIYLKPLE